MGQGPQGQQDGSKPDNAELFSQAPSGRPDKDWLSNKTSAKPTARRKAYSTGRPSQGRSGTVLQTARQNRAGKQDTNETRRPASQHHPAPGPAPPGTNTNPSSYVPVREHRTIRGGRRAMPNRPNQQSAANQRNQPQHHPAPTPPHHPTYRYVNTVR